MSNKAELTYFQLKERLKFLIKKYPLYKIQVNTKQVYEPESICGKELFRFDEDDNFNYLCYIIPRPCQVNNEIILCCTEERELSLLNDEYYNQKVIIADNTGKTFYICNVYVDKETASIVLLNSYYNDEPISWSELDINNMY